MDQQGSEVVILGTAQDGGIPQIGCDCPHCKAAWKDESQRQLVTSLAIVDQGSKTFWLVDASPDLREQIHSLADSYPRFSLGGILLTHAHIGHYLGLAALGRESWNRIGLPILCTQQMGDFLRANQPWKQLVYLNNISLSMIAPGQKIVLGQALAVTPIAVPHRDELSDTMAFSIAGSTRRLTYCPDIDRWEGAILDEIMSADIALLDGTFYSSDELPGRDVSEIPHPCIVDSMKTFEGYKTEIHFIHLNHSNPLLSDERLVRHINSLGFGMTSRGQRHPL
ncbi:pyrroloquinoline quinone biosynthesis protein PqqB [Candidatus Bipolaricaulota bacterium]|nr:pyrroloquinoline quinone biosynthesis protein PqqB [Candidatus Bipolaricaulota bacterium]